MTPIAFADEREFADRSDEASVPGPPRRTPSWELCTLDDDHPIDSTMRHSLGDSPVEAAAAISRLRPISLAPSSHPDALEAELVAIQVLGEGGMGSVLLCHQSSLDRDVVVKTARGVEPSSASVFALLQEARINSTLEHPGIVPIYEVGALPDGRPALVMKRVTGTVWRHMLLKAEHPRWASVPDDRLRWNLGVLRKVCDVVAFAHAHGVVHRDLKSGNVMIGTEGEVYVLDWGIAMELHRPDEAARWIGTPGFMAPEMLSGGSDPITPRTDVFLLGGILHEVLTGRSRHGGLTLREVLYNALLCEPPVFPPEVPATLAALCTQATQGVAADRPDIVAFTRALDAWIEHHDAAHLPMSARHHLSTALARQWRGVRTSSSVRPRPALLALALVGGLTAFGTELWEGHSLQRSAVQSLLVCAGILGAMGALFDRRLLCAAGGTLAAGAMAALPWPALAAALGVGFIAFAVWCVRDVIAPAQPHRSGRHTTH